jgi:hypothetical protein
VDYRSKLLKYPNFANRICVGPMTMTHVRRILLGLYRYHVAGIPAKCKVGTIREACPLLVPLSLYIGIIQHFSTQ